MNKELENKIDKTKSRIQLMLLALFGAGTFLLFFDAGDASLKAIIVLFLVMFVGQTAHEYLHSLASKLTLGDWGKIYFGIMKGYFWTPKAMNTLQFTIISLTPLLVMEIIIVILEAIGFDDITMRSLALGIFGACVGDLSTTLTLQIFRKEVPVIELPNPKEMNKTPN